MKLDLREIIEMPGTSVPFRCELETERLDHPSVLEYTSPPTAEGRVVNTAGALTLVGTLRAEMLCVCDRCGGTFPSEKVMDLEIPLAAEAEDEESADVFLLEGDALDLDEVLGTVFILDMETKFLCREDCAGLCERCGANLNLGPCACKARIDPRMAVLEQLLDKKDE